MKQSCIQHLPNDRLAILRASYVAICDGNHCAALLLNFLEYWHNIRLEQAPKATEQNRVAELHGDPPAQDTSLYQFHNEDDLKAGLCGLYGKDTIRGALMVLMSKGFVSIHKNPNPRYAFDSTKHFLFSPGPVSYALANLKVVNPSPENRQRSAETSERLTENRGTSPGVTPKITPEIPQDSHQSQECLLPQPPQKTPLRAGKVFERTGYRLVRPHDPNDELVRRCLAHYYAAFKNRTGQKHPRLKASQLATRQDILSAAFDQYEVTTPAQVAQLIESYWARSFVKMDGTPGTNGNLNAFATEKTLNLLAFQLQWQGVDMELLPHGARDE